MASLSGWSEAGIGIILLVVCLGIIVVSMNIDYGKTNDPTFGFSSNETQSQLEAYQSTLQTGVAGEASTNAINGVSVTSSWGIIKAGISLAWDITSGKWINNAIALLGWGAAGTALAWALRLLFIFSVGFILIKILFKIKP